MVIPELQCKGDHHLTRLQTHNVCLRGESVTLRHVTEGDWKVLRKWNNGPEARSMS